MLDIIHKRYKLSLSSNKKMKNLKGHKVNIPNSVIEKCWDIYSKRYRQVELNLKSPSTKTNQNLHSTGAYQITEKQAQSLTEDKIFKYYLKNKNGLLIKLKSKYLLRGKNYFPGYSKENYSAKSKIIFSRLIEMLELAGNLNKNTNLILYLSLLDYIKNYLLICLYAINLLIREFKIEHEIISKHDYLCFIKLIQLIEDIYVTSCLEETPHLAPELSNFTGLISRIEKFIGHYGQLLTRNERLSLDLFRKIRECNNPERLMSFADMVSNSYFSINSLIISLEYGGIELPFMVNALRNYKGKNMVRGLTVNLSSYSTKNSDFVQSLDDIVNPFTLPVFSDDLRSIVILDDSVTTGRTLERLVGMLPDSISTINFAAVSFTNTNRFHHLTRKKHGGINPYIVEGSLFAYRSNFVSTYTKSSYTNKNGVFDKEKYKIIKLLKGL